MSFRIIVADNEELFRVGTARLLGVEDDLRVVAQCSDISRLLQAADSFSGATVLCATSLGPDFAAVKLSLDALNCKAILLLENSEAPRAYVDHGFPGLLYRGAAPQELLSCVRSVAAGNQHLQRQPRGTAPSATPDALGEKARKRLTRKELQIVTLLVQGYKNKDIAEELGNTEQVIKNYMRSIFDKTGVIDRLELALFVIHHRVLLEPAVPLLPSPQEQNQFRQRAAQGRTNRALTAA